MPYGKGTYGSKVGRPPKKGGPGKKKKVKGKKKTTGPRKKPVPKKDNGGVKRALKKGKVTKAKTSSKPTNKQQLALKKRADARDKKKSGRKTLAQLRKEGKINF